MSIVIFGDNFSFPEGNAATNRIYTYAKGFVENGIDVFIICNRNDYVTNGNGTLDSIRYYNPLNQSERSDSFLIRNWYKIAKYFNTLKLVREINKKEKVSAVLTDTHDIVTHLFSYYLAKRIGTKLVVEKSEHPLRLHQQNFIRKIQGLVKLRIESFLCDGLLCISQYLMIITKNTGFRTESFFLSPVPSILKGLSRMVRSLFRIHISVILGD